MIDMSGFLPKFTMDQKRNVGVYIHVPFCLSKCHYCDFCSVTRADDELKEKYVQSLCREIDSVAEALREAGTLPVADTVYFGGGTPTLLSSSQLERLLETVHRNFGISPNAEITAETNPKSVDGEYLREIRSIGINRLSIGMQSANDFELKALGRIHRFKDFEKIIHDASDSGFDNISVDLMYGIPEQTPESFRYSLEKLISFAPQHISSYCLTVEEDTNFGRRKDRLVLPDEDTVSNMYSEMSLMLKESGYCKYEISNFSKSGRESRHNLKYWKYDDYLGFGVAAHSFYNGVRFAHSRDIHAYIEDKSIIIEIDHIEKNEAMNEYVMLGMRLEQGVSFSKFASRFGESFAEKFPLFYKYSPEYVSVENGRCCFTEKGMFVSNYILSEALDF